MTDKYQVGEIAIYVRPGSPYFGKEVEILGELKYVLVGFDFAGRRREPTFEWCYDITDLCPKNPGIAAASPEWLKKKPQKRDIDELVSWDYLSDLMKKKVSA
jgi:hypothetical protein